MGNHSASMTPPNAQARQHPPGSHEAYAGVRVQAMPGGGRVINDAGAADGRRRRMSWGSSAPPSRPQTVVQKTKLVRNTCHVRKDTVAFKKEDKAGGKYQLSFRFDADVACKVAVYLVATESKNADGRLSHHPLLPGEDDWVVGPHRFEAGANQAYSTAGLGFPGVDFSTAWRMLVVENGGKSVKLPLLCFIVLRPDGGEVHSQVTGVGVDPKTSGGGEEGDEEVKVWTSRVIKQKIETPDGTFVLQEIYGIAGTTAGGSNATDSTAEEGDDMSTSECVVCLTNKRELAILPCRHMCVCRACAAECIQSQDSRCPICRNPAQALLKLTLDDDDRHHQARDAASRQT